MHGLLCTELLYATDGCVYIILIKERGHFHIVRYPLFDLFIVCTMLQLHGSKAMFVLQGYVSCREGQKAIDKTSTGDGIASCISSDWTYLCPKRFAFLPAHHRNCLMVNCVQFLLAS